MAKESSTVTLPGWTPAHVDKFGQSRHYPVVPDKVLFLSRLLPIMSWAGGRTVIIIICLRRHWRAYQVWRVLVVVGVCFCKEERRMLDPFRWEMLVMEGCRYRWIRGVECALGARRGSGRLLYNDDLKPVCMVLWDDID